VQILLSAVWGGDLRSRGQQGVLVAICIVERVAKVSRLRACIEHFCAQTDMSYSLLYRWRLCPDRGLRMQSSFAIELQDSRRGRNQEASLVTTGITIHIHPQNRCFGELLDVTLIPCKSQPGRKSVQ
jgi:hypothetical protein